MLISPHFSQWVATRHTTRLCAFYTKHRASESSATRTERVRPHPFQQPRPGRHREGSRRQQKKASQGPHLLPLPSPPAQEDPLLSHWPPRPSRPQGPALLQVHPRSLSDSQQSPFQATLIPPAWMKSFLLSQRTTRGPKGAAGAECQRTGCTLSPRNVSSCGKLCKKWSSSAKS